MKMIRKITHDEYIRVYRDLINHIQHKEDIIEDMTEYIVKNGVKNNVMCDRKMVIECSKKQCRKCVRNYFERSSEMSIDEAIEEFDFFFEGDYITKDMEEAKNIVMNELYKKRSDLDKLEKKVISLILDLGDRDRMIDKMAEQLTTPVHNKKWVIEYFEKESK